MDDATLAAELARRGMCESEAEAFRIIEAFDEHKYRRDAEGKFARKAGALARRKGRTAPGSGRTGSARVRGPGETARKPKPKDGAVATAEPDVAEPDVDLDNDPEKGIPGGTDEEQAEQAEALKKGRKVMQGLAKAIPKNTVKKWHRDLGAFSAKRTHEEVLAPGVENDAQAVAEALHRTEMIGHEVVTRWPEIQAAAAALLHLVNSADDEDEDGEPLLEDDPSD